ncbi:MAG: cytochrome c maturation protein CcmE [Alcanivorax sp.]|uniref:cytochrome c maturation protein CcmE n=1 Tax=Alcanivorax sp. TaxID=1872427 RepID=UPI002612CF52|nr:cytochrome c maturation protein CcmE [Alcanivorax sp.]MDF1724932.1 cytochrome c maturation protein CcmE [Alcanivorax sp.]
MNAVRKQRLILVISILVGLAIACGLMFYALRQNINLFFTPQQVMAGEAPLDTQMRVGGLVEEGSVVRDQETLDVQFVLTDGKGSFTVHYQGILPDLFREGQGIVANGTLISTNRFEAEEVLAKHDETYMPPEVQDALEKAGHPGAKKGSE